MSRSREIRGGGVAVLYMSGLTLKPIHMRDYYTNFEHSDYCVTISNVRLWIVYRKRNGFSDAVVITSGLRF